MDKRVVLKITQGRQKTDCGTVFNIIFGKLNLALLKLIQAKIPSQLPTGVSSDQVDPWVGIETAQEIKIEIENKQNPKIDGIITFKSKRTFQTISYLISLK